MIKKLGLFRLEETEEGYVLTVGAEGGDTIEVEVSPDQMEAIIDTFDDMLIDEDDEGDEVANDG